jgi:Ran GTPase-activating protein (RanGAP) involved in mRNA processing and transport
MEGVVKLLNSLKGNQVLKKLNLARNDLGPGDQGYHVSVFNAFEQFLSLNRSLEELILNDCKLGIEGAAIIGKGLRKNQKLSKLSLS